MDIGDRTFTFEFVDMDDQYNPAETAQNVEEMIGQDGDGAFGDIQRSRHGQQHRHP